MKFLEVPELDLLSRALSLSNATIKVSARVEAYSCKAVARERKLFKTLDSELTSDLTYSTSVSPPEHHQGLLDSAFGPLDKRESRKTLWLLIALLNVAFPDHDFSKVRPEDFRREDGPRDVLSSLSAAVDHLRSPTGQRSFSTLPPSGSFAFPSSPYSEPISLPGGSAHDGDVPTNPFLRQVLDPIIDLAECEVYSYTPDADSDPHAVDSDDESDDDGGDPDAFERDSDGGMAWEMEDLGNMSGYGSRNNHPSSGALGNHSSSRGGAVGRGGSFHSALWQARPATPMKSIASVFPGNSAPGTPASFGDADDYFGDSTGGLLWSTFHFLYNRKAKRIVFITAWARTPLEHAHVRPRVGGVSRRAAALKRSRSRGSTARGSTLGTRSDESDAASADENTEPVLATGAASGSSGAVAATAAAQVKAARAARMKRSASNTSVSMPKAVPSKKKTKAAA